MISFFLNQKRKKKTTKISLVNIQKKVVTVLENGMNSLTKGQLDQIDLFTESLNRIVETFKQDLQSTLRERENGSLKQLDTAKARFLENIKSFKRRKARIP